MLDKKYTKQVALLLDVLPEVAKETCFAMHGGTAINLFVRDMPRLSVDIDLTYVPIEERTTSLKHITPPSNTLSILLFHPLEEGGFVDQHAATATADDFFKAVLFSEENEVTHPADGWPLMVLIPFGDGDEARLLFG